MSYEVPDLPSIVDNACVEDLLLQAEVPQVEVGELLEGCLVTESGARKLNDEIYEIKCRLLDCSMCVHLLRQGDIYQVAELTDTCSKKCTDSPEE